MNFQTTQDASETPFLYLPLLVSLDFLEYRVLHYTLAKHQQTRLIVAGIMKCMAYLFCKVTGLRCNVYVYYGDAFLTL
jgi:hypothetical protein